MKFRMMLIATIFFVMASMANAAQPSGTVTFTITPTVDQESGDLKLWVPYPMSNKFQTIKDVSISGNYHQAQVLRDADSEAVYLYANWSSISAKPYAVMSFHISQKDRRNNDIKEIDAPYPAEIKKYLKSSKWVPSDDKEMQKIAKDAVKGKKGTLEKAKAVYDWVVENTFRDPNVKGCGLGEPSRTLNACNGGGKCADLSTVFVTIARAAGIPARDVYGLRLSSPKVGDITSGFHCWAEFYLPGTGWVMVDPADVRKMMLVHKIELKDAGDWRKFFWGGDDLFRVVLEKNSRGVSLEGAKEDLNYFMYPAAEVDGKMLNYFDSKGFSYKVNFEKDK